MTRTNRIPLLRKLEFQARKDEEESRTKDRVRFIAAINSGREFSGVMARSHDMLKRRRQRIVSCTTFTPDAKSMRAAVRGKEVVRA